MESAITSKGQVTIPKAIREYLHVKPGDRVKFFMHPDGTVVLLPKLPVTALRGPSPDAIAAGASEGNAPPSGDDPGSVARGRERTRSVNRDDGASPGRAAAHSADALTHPAALCAKAGCSHVVTFDEPGDPTTTGSVGEKHQRAHPSMLSRGGASGGGLRVVEGAMRRKPRRAVLRRVEAADQDALVGLHLRKIKPALRLGL